MQIAWRKALPRQKSRNHPAPCAHELLMMKGMCHSQNLYMLHSDLLAGTFHWVVVLVGVAAAQTLLPVITA